MDFNTGSGLGNNTFAAGDQYRFRDVLDRDNDGSADTDIILTFVSFTNADQREYNGFNNNDALRGNRSATLDNGQTRTDLFFFDLSNLGNASSPFPRELTSVRMRMELARSASVNPSTGAYTLINPVDIEYTIFDIDSDNDDEPLDTVNNGNESLDQFTAIEANAVGVDDMTELRAVTTSLVGGEYQTTAFSPYANADSLNGGDDPDSWFAATFQHKNVNSFEFEWGFQYSGPGVRGFLLDAGRAPPYSFTMMPVPEPSTYVAGGLFFASVAAASVARRRKRNADRAKV